MDGKSRIDDGWTGQIDRWDKWTDEWTEVLREVVLV